MQITLGSVWAVNSENAERMLDVLLDAPALKVAWSQKDREGLLRGRPKLDPELLSKPDVREAVVAALDAVTVDNTEPD